MERNCSFCNTKSPHYFYSKDYNRKVTQEKYNHYRCPQCKLIFISPLPEELSDYYPDTYHKVPKSVEELDITSKNENYKIEIVQRFSGKGRLLEIGPSFGTFSYLAKKAGYTVEAVEMNARCGKFLNETVGVNTVISNNPVEILQNRETYDVITLWHVIEHTPNLWQILDAVYTNLKVGGLIVLASPNPDSFQFKIMGKYWPHLDAPRHVMLIPIKLLTEKLGSLGMKQEMVTTQDFNIPSLNRFGWKSFFKRGYLGKVGIVIYLLVKPIENTEGKGSGYTMVFRKTI